MMMFISLRHETGKGVPFKNNLIFYLELNIAEKFGL